MVRYGSIGDWQREVLGWEREIAERERTIDRFMEQWPFIEAIVNDLKRLHRVTGDGAGGGSGGGTDSLDLVACANEFVAGSDHRERIFGTFC